MKFFEFISHLIIDVSNKTEEKVVDFYKAIADSRRNVNVLGLIVFCFVFGAVIAQMGRSGKILYDFFESLNQATIKIIKLVMLLEEENIDFLVISKLAI
jgi:Na+/H+-dicarboxylate symporter